MDSPYDNKSYFPPMQLLHKDIFGYVMAQMETNPEFAVTVTQMSANAGLKRYGRGFNGRILTIGGSQRVRATRPE